MEGEAVPEMLQLALTVQELNLMLQTGRARLSTQPEAQLSIQEALT